MKRTIALFLAVIFLLAGCQTADPKTTFFNALEKQSEMKNAHETAAFSLTMDNKGEPYTFMDGQLEGDVNMENLDMAVNYDFSVMDLGIKMGVYKTGENFYLKMPIIAGYLQMPSSLFPMYGTENLQAMQQMSLEENKAFYEGLGDKLTFSKKSSQVIASFDVDGATAKPLISNMLSRILTDENIRSQSIDQQLSTQKSMMEQLGLAESFTEEDWQQTRSALEAAYDQQMQGYLDLIDQMEIQSFKGQSTVDKNGFLTAGSFDLVFTLSGTSMTLHYESTLSNINNVSEIAYPAFTDSNTISYESLMAGNVDLETLNPFFAILSQMGEDSILGGMEEENVAVSVPLPETGTPARPSL